MTKRGKDKLFDNLPACAAEFITLVIKKMRYRKKVRDEVMAELIAHFEDELRDCKSEEKEQKAQKLIEDFGDVKLLGVLLRRAKKRCRPLWRTVVARTFQAVGVLLLCLVVYLVWFFTGKPVITVDYVAELNRIVQPAVDESLNAATLYEKAIELYDEKSSDEMSELLGTKYNKATDEQKQLIKQWLEDNDDFFYLIAAGTNKPYYWREYKESEGSEGLMSVLLPHLSEFRRIAYALRWRAQIHADQGRYEKALSDIKTCYHLGQHVKGNFILVEQHVGMAIESVAARTLRSILSKHKINSATLAALQKDFEQIIANEDFVVSLETEKLFTYDEIQRCFTQDRLGGGHLYLSRVNALSGENTFKLHEKVLVLMFSPQNWPNVAHFLFMHPNKQQTRETADRYYAWAENMVRKTPAQIRAEGIDFEKETMEMIEGNFLLGIMSPAVGRIAEISHRTKADVEATLTIIAMLRCRQDTGYYPESLDELSATSYLKQVPTDPFSNKPLIYKRTEDNFILYSVSLNFTDDGGEVYRDDEGRVRLWGDVGDWVFWPVQK